MSEANDNTNNNYKKKPLTPKEEQALLQVCHMQGQNNHDI